MSDKVSNAQLFMLLSDTDLSQLIGSLEYVSKELDKALSIVSLCALSDQGDMELKPESSPYGQALIKFRSELGTLMLKDLIWERYNRRGF